MNYVVFVLLEVFSNSAVNIFDVVSFAVRKLIIVTNNYNK